MQGRGVKVRVLTSDGQHIEGWFYSQNSLGFYISLDPQGRNIRFISQRDLSAIGYHRDAPKADFADGARPDVVEAAAEFERETGDRIITILERIDYNRVQRAGKHLRSTRFSLRDIEMQIRVGQYTPGIPDTGNLLEIALETHEAIKELLWETHDSGLLRILIEQSSQIRNFLSRETLPAIDAEVASQDEIGVMLAQVESRDLLAEGIAPREVTSGALARTVLSIGETLAEDKGKTEPSPWARRLRITSVLGKIALGGTFAAANIGVGTLVGIVTALPTLTLGSVSVLAGIIGSVYTGTNASLDALKDLATVVESQ